MTDSAGNVIPAWRVFWTIFGTSNQLLAALTLMMISVWLARSGKSWWVSGIPMFFMLTMTLWSLKIMAAPLVIRLMRGSFYWESTGWIALVLLVLALLLIVEALKAWRRVPSLRNR
jgi:carbon starvation protein